MSRGHDRERAVRAYLTDRDWLAFRAPASLGVADVIALRDGSRPLLIEVKSTAGGPYAHFLPKDRADLLFAAEMAGAAAWLVWWPPRGRAHWIESAAWERPRQRQGWATGPEGEAA